MPGVCIGWKGILPRKLGKQSSRQTTEISRKVQGCSKALLSESHTVITVYFFEIPRRSVRETGQDVLFPVYRRHHVQRDRMIFSVPVGR